MNDVEADRAIETDEDSPDVANAVLHHIDSMYPAMWKAVPKTARTSVRNTIRAKVNGVLAELEARLKHSKAMFRISYDNCEWFKQKLAQRTLEVEDRDQEIDALKHDLEQALKGRNGEMNGRLEAEAKLSRCSLELEDARKCADLWKADYDALKEQSA